MSERYEEIVEGESYLRCAPGARHEEICARLHTRVAACLPPGHPARLLTPRSIVQLSAGTMVRPDLAVIAAATGKAWLVAEVIDSEDHRIDTVVKKAIYEETNVPRLWMLDPRYDNLEVYHGTPYGLALQHILVNRQVLKESLLPALEVPVGELFKG